MESLKAANLAAKQVKWWTEITVSNVLHRRRPHIVPLIDSRVYDFYGADCPIEVRAALWEDIRVNAEWLTDLAATKAAPDGRPLSLLCLADILIWTPHPKEELHVMPAQPWACMGCFTLQLQSNRRRWLQQVPRSSQ